MLLKTICLLIAYCSITTVTIHTVQHHIQNKKITDAKQQLVDTKSATNTKSILKKRAAFLKTYCIKYGYNDSICFMINFAIPSGKPRFFVYDIKRDSILHTGLVTHGSGSETKDGKFVFKNIPNSLASAEGKYKIGASYYGKFGLAYKLYGLDKTNDKSFERFVVLHSHECVPSKTVHPLPICVSWGCPTVAPSFLQILAPIINASTKPILLDMAYTL